VTPDHQQRLGIFLRVGIDRETLGVEGNVLVGDRFVAAILIESPNPGQLVDDRQRKSWTLPNAGTRM